MKKICFITGSRADYGIMRNLILKLFKNKNFKIQFIVIGSHFSKKLGYSFNEILEDGFKINKKINISLNNDTDSGVADRTGKFIARVSKQLINLNPDAVLILGDRYEIFSAAIASYILKKPIIHFCGGDITEGSLDNGFRHSISKMSNLHFVTNNLSKRVLLQLGENPSNVYNTGSLTVEKIKKMKFLNKKELQKKFRLKFLNRNALITYHPEITEHNSSVKGIKELLLALKKFSGTLKIFTAANSDDGGKKINQIIKRFVKFKKNNSIFLPSVGSRNYLSFLNNVDFVIGNSSSGISEAPSFGIGTINIGNRQKGRLMASSVLNTKANKTSIVKTINKIYEKSFKQKLKKTINPYEKKNTLKKIIKILNKKNFKKLYKEKKLI